MSLDTATITGKLVRPDQSRWVVSAWITLGTDGGRATAEGQVIGGTVPVTIAGDGTATLPNPLVQVPQAGVEPDEARYRLNVETTDGKTNSWEFELIGDTTWDAIVSTANVPLTYTVQKATEDARDAALQAAEDAEAARAEAEGLRNEAADLRDQTQEIREGIVGDLSTTDSQIATLATPGAGSLTEAAIAAQLGKEAAAAADGTTNDSPAIQALIDDGPGKVSLRSVTPAGSSAPYYLVRDTIDVPYTSSLSGDKYRTRITIPTDGGDFDGDTVFRLNSDGATWVKAFPNTPATEVASMFINAKAASDAGHRPVIFEFGGSQHLHDHFAYGVDRLVKQLPGTSADIARVDRNFCFGKPDTANYLIDLSGGGGDGIVVRQNGMSQDPASTSRLKHIYMKQKSGFVVEGNLNGDIYLKDCRNGRVSSNYLEEGRLTLDVVDADVSQNHFFMRNVGDKAGTPLVITSTDASATSLRGAILELRGDTFTYTTHLNGGYPTDGTPNFQITAASGAINRARVAVRNLVRQVRSAGVYADTVLAGVTCGDAAFDAYSHLASRESVYDMGSWLIRADLAALESSTGLDEVKTDDGTRTWAAATGTYYYKVVNYHDTKRGLGRVGSLEQSAALTNGGNGAALVLNSGSRCPSMIRVYRGTATGSYNKYVDIPFMAGGRLHDSGNDIAGFAWVSRTAGAVDSVNANLDAGFSLSPGEITAASDAYGHAKVFARSLSTAPSVGSWRRGDEVYGPPTMTSAGVQIGWRRITDCTTASPTHVMGTDWTPIYVTTRGFTRVTGSPNNNLPGDLGDIAVRSDGSLGVNLVYVKTEGASGTNTGWTLGSPFAPFTATTANLIAVGSDINAKGKVAGKMVWNTTTNKPVWATGSTTTSVWVDATGATVHTPS